MYLFVVCLLRVGVLCFEELSMAERKDIISCLPCWDRSGSQCCPCGSLEDYQASSPSRHPQPRQRHSWWSRTGSPCPSPPPSQRQSHAVNPSSNYCCRPTTCCYCAATPADP